MDAIIGTERLELRKYDLTDAAFILELLNTENWLRFIGDRNVHSVADAENYLKNGPIKNYKELGFGFYAVENRQSKALIGMCGFTKRDYLEAPDIGFAFLPEYYGNGYGFEAGNASLEYGKNVLKFKKILATVDAENKASIALLKKLDFSYLEKIKAPNVEKELHLYRHSNKN